MQYISTCYIGLKLENCYGTEGGFSEILLFKVDTNCLESAHLTSANKNSKTGVASGHGLATPQDGKLVVRVWQQVDVFTV